VLYKKLFLFLDIVVFMIQRLLFLIILTRNGFVMGEGIHLEGFTFSNLFLLIVDNLCKLERSKKSFKC